jgi:hypothetical protein
MMMPITGRRVEGPFSKTKGMIAGSPSHGLASRVTRVSRVKSRAQLARGPKTAGTLVFIQASLNISRRNLHDIPLRSRV